VWRRSPTLGVWVANVVKTGPEAGRRVELDLEVAIGRQDGDLVVEDPEVSRRHAVLRRSGGSVVVEDLDSTNGTFVNGERIRSLWGAFIRFTIVSRAFGPGAEPGFGQWKAPEIRRRTRRHPFEVEREALRGPRVLTRVLNRTRPSRVSGRPVGELAPHPMSCSPASKDTRSAARSQ
jgi:hypothetical protein